MDGLVRLGVEHRFDHPVSTGQKSITAATLGHGEQDLDECGDDKPEEDVVPTVFAWGPFVGPVTLRSRPKLRQGVDDLRLNRAVLERHVLPFLRSKGNGQHSGPKRVGLKDSSRATVLGLD